MAILATWGKFSTYTDAAGFYRVIWQDVTSGQIIMHKFDSVKTLTYMERFFDKQIRGGDGIVQEIEFSEDDEVILKVGCIYILTHPTLTLNDWNAYLNELGYQKAEVFKAYIHKLALKLAEKYGVTLTNYTELEIWIKVRDWICNTDLDIVKRVIFGYLISL